MYAAGVHSATREHVSVHTRGLVHSEGPAIAIKWVAKIASRLLSVRPCLSLSGISAGRGLVLVVFPVGEKMQGVAGD